MSVWSMSHVSGLAAHWTRFLRRVKIWFARPKPIRLFLFLLLASVIVPALAISLILLQRTDAAQREVVSTLAEAMVDSLADSVDRELTGMVTTLRVLSTIHSLQLGEMKEFHDKAKLALAGTSTHLMVYDENLKPLLDTRVEFGGPLEAYPETSFPRSQIQEEMRAGSTTVSGVFRPSSSQEVRAFRVQFPFISEDQDVFILVLARDVDTMVDTLGGQTLRGGWNAAIVDRNGLLIASSDQTLQAATPFFLWPLARETHGLVTQSDGKGEDYLSVQKKSRLSNWRVIAWSPVRTVEGPMRAALWTLLAGSLLIIALGTFVAVAIGQQIVGPVRRLARDAQLLGSGARIHSVQYPISEMATVSSALAEAGRNRKKAEHDIRLLMREVAHRAKNQLTVVSSMAKQSARHARSLSGFLDSFQKRLYGLARSTDLLIAGAGDGVELAALIRIQLEPFRPDDKKRCEVEGPSLRLENQAAQTLGMAIHELATNAAKHGAFSDEQGRLVVTWSQDDNNLYLVWREYFPVNRRHTITRRGFGTEIIERMLSGALSATVERTFHTNGFKCTMEIPLSQIYLEGTAAKQIERPQVPYELHQD